MAEEHLGSQVRVQVDQYGPTTGTLNIFTQLAVGPSADYGLSGREPKILALLVAGNTKGEIAQRLSLGPHTIDGHVRSIYAKLHVNNRSGAVAKALKERIL